MPNIPADLDYRALREAELAGPKGPWHKVYSKLDDGVETWEVFGGTPEKWIAECICYSNAEECAAFIVLARNSWSQILDAAESAATAREDALREALAAILQERSSLVLGSTKYQFAMHDGAKKFSGFAEAAILALLNKHASEEK